VFCVERGKKDYPRYKYLFIELLKISIFVS